MTISLSIPRTSPSSSVRPAAVESLWIAALLTCFAADEEVRHRARAVFGSAARWLVWAVLAGQTPANVSPSYLSRTTAYATELFLRLWPGQRHASPGAMLELFADVVRAVAHRDVILPPTAGVVPSALGVLTPLSDAARYLLLQIVQGDLRPDDVALLTLVSNDPLNVYCESPACEGNVADAVRRMEASLLGVVRYELGTAIFAPGLAHAA